MEKRYFALKLVDYGPAINNGNCQWVVSTGCDSQPFFKIFYPRLQKKVWSKLQSHKKWIPELRDSYNLIHEWYNTVNSIIYKYLKLFSIGNKPKPIVENQ